jgi:hypothetical protein
MYWRISLAPQQRGIGISQTERVEEKTRNE